MRAQPVGVGSLLVIAACHTQEPRPPIVASAPTAARAAGPSLPVPKALAEAARDASSMPYVRIAELGSTMLVADGSDVGPSRTLDSCNDFELPVIAVDSTRVQVALRSGDTMLAVWVPIAHLATVVHVPTQVRSTPSERENGVTLRPGAPVRELSARGADSQVVLDHLGERVTGWVPTSALGFMYAPEPRTTSAIKQVWIANGHPLRARADASAPPTFTNLFGGPYRLVAEANGFAELAYAGQFVDARGFVASSVLNKSGFTGMCEGGSNHFMVGALHTGFGQLFSGPIEIPAGTCLRSDAGGPIVGLRLTTAVAEVSVTAASWAELRVDNAWGGHMVSVPVDKKADGTYVVSEGSCECRQAGPFAPSC